MLKKSLVIEEIKSIIEKKKLNEYIDSYFQNEMYYNNNEDYKKLKKEYINLYCAIDEKLLEDEQQKLDSLIEIIFEMSSFDIRYAYKIGLVDGITTRNEITNI